MTRTWPKVEALTVSRLAGVLAVPTSTQVPSPRPTRFVTVSLAGTSVRDIGVRDATVIVECWAASDSEASDLADFAVTALTGWETLTTWVPEGAEGWAGGPYAYPDGVAGQSRYQMTVIVRCIEETL